MTEIRYQTPFPHAVWLVSLAVSISAVVAIYAVLPSQNGLLGYLTAFSDATRYMADLIVYAFSVDLNQALGAAHWRTLSIPALLLLVPLAWIPTAAVAAIRARKPANDASWANSAEVRNMGLHGKLGPVLGVHNGKVLRPDETRHVLAVAPTRAGKTRQAISTVLDYPGTVVVIDPKDEIRQITNPHRSKIGPTYHIAFADPATPDGWNPVALRAVPKDNAELERSAARLAGIFAPKNPGASDSHWDDTAFRNTTALLMWEMCEARRTQKDGHLSNLIKHISDLPEADPEDEDADPFALKMAQMATHATNHGFPVNVATDLINFANIHFRERSSHVSTLLTKLQEFRLESAHNALGKDSFEWTDLRARPSTVYIDYPRADAQAFGKLVASFIDGLTSWALSRGRKEGEYPILVIMDEFRDNPYIPNFISGMTAGAGLGITFYPIVQTLGQLKERYRDSWENIRNNVEYLILFENPDPETQRLVSEIVGEYTTSAKTESKSKAGWSKGYSESERRKRLINPSEIGVIPFGHHIVLARRHQMRPILCKSAFWDQLKEFRRLVPRKARIKT